MKKVFFLVMTFMLGYLSVSGQVRGSASYYCSSLNGRLTANGERFCIDSLTAAHKTLPFGTIVRVTDPGTGRSVVVKINDRLPATSTRMIDLSPCAARELRMIQRGLLSVILEIQ